jgi:hypothetical protein
LIVRVHQDSSITLEDPDTFTAFSLSAPGLEAAQIAAAFGPDAEARDEEHVWISIARLRALGRAYGVANRLRRRCGSAPANLRGRARCA